MMDPPAPGKLGKRRVPRGWSHPKELTPISGVSEEDLKELYAMAQIRIGITM